MVKVGTLGKAFVLCKGKVGLLFWNIVVVINRRGEIGDINTINIFKNDNSLSYNYPLFKDVLERGIEDYRKRCKHWRKKNPLAEQKRTARAYAKRRKLGFIKITPTPNYPFAWHHIDTNRVIAVPAFIHRHVSHNAPTPLIEGEMG